MVLRTLWAACAVFVPLVVIAVAAVEAVSHPRGIAFVPQLRYALMTPACAISAVSAAFLYGWLKANPIGRDGCSARSSSGSPCLL